MKRNLVAHAFSYCCGCCGSNRTGTKLGFTPVAFSMSFAASCSRFGTFPAGVGRYTCVTAVTLPFASLATASPTRVSFAPPGVGILTSVWPPIFPASSLAVCWWSGAPFEPSGFETFLAADCVVLSAVLLLLELLNQLLIVLPTEGNGVSLICPIFRTGQTDRCPNSSARQPSASASSVAHASKCGASDSPTP